MIQLSSADVSHPYAFKYEIYSFYSASAFPCPAGWSTAADGTYFYASSATPPPFTLPASHANFGDFYLRLTINNGDPGASGLPVTQFIDESTALRLVGDSGVVDTGWMGGTQFNAHGFVADMQANWRLLNAGLGSGFGTGSIADHAVTYVKIQQVAASKLLGNPTGSLANAQEIGLGGGLDFTGTTLERSALTGDVTAAAGSNSTTIANNAVTFAKEQQIGVGLVGNDSGTANQKLITLGAGLAFSAGTLVVAAAGVALSMLANIGAHTFLGNNTGSPAAPIALTATQLTAELNVATTTLKGLVPAPGTATGKFLNDSLAWATPSGSFTSPANPGDNGKLSYANAGTNAWTSAIHTDGTYLGLGSSPATAGVIRLSYGNLVNGLAVDTVTNATIYKWGQAGDGTDNCIIFGDTATTAKEIWNVKTGGSYFWNWNGTGFVSFAPSAFSFTQQATTSGAAPAALTVIGAAHTGLNASTEVTDVNFGLNRTVTMATGDVTSMRAIRVQAVTYAFAAASNIGEAISLSVGMPVAGANATFTNAAAIRVGTGGALAFGGSPATPTTKVWSATGLIRTLASPGVVLAVAGALGAYDIPAISVNGSDVLTWGGSGSNSPVTNIYNTRSGGTHDFQVAGTSEATLSSTQLDLHSNALVNVSALNGTQVATGLLGTTLADANETLSVNGGNVYEQITPLSATRSKGLAVTGATLGSIISIRRYTTDANPLQINDEVGNPLFTFPGGQKRIADFVFNGTKFQLLGHMKLS